MHYYQFHIGDYASHTRHLSLIEDLAYRRLLDFYYLHEQPIKQRDIARQIGMRDQEQDVLTVLNEFFVSTDLGFVSPRADKEIKHFHEKLEQASRAGKASAERRLSKRSTLVQTDVQPTNNHKPITNNQVKKEPMVLPDWLDKDVWKAFVEMRSKIKKPLTETAVKLVWKKLEKMKESGYSTTQVLENSISNCWLDVYEPKRPTNTVSNGLAGAI